MSGKKREAEIISFPPPCRDASEITDDQFSDEGKSPVDDEATAQIIPVELLREISWYCMLDAAEVHLQKLQDDERSP